MFLHKCQKKNIKNLVPTHRHSFILWSTPPQARLLRSLSSKTLANQILRLRVGLISITPPFPESSNALWNLAILTSGNTSLVTPVSSRSVMFVMLPFYLLALKLPMSLNSPKRPSLKSLASQFPGHYMSMDSSHRSVDLSPGSPRPMWPSTRHGQLHMPLGLSRTGSRWFSPTSPNSCYSNQMGASIVG